MKRWMILIALLFVGLADAEVIYSNEFTEAAGTNAANTVAAINLIDSYLAAATAGVVTDGTGKLHCTAKGSSYNYRFRLDPTPLEQDLSLSGVKATVVMRAPQDNEWVGIGFQGVNANGVLNDNSNAIWLQVNQNSIFIRGGELTVGSLDKVLSTHTNSQVFTLEYTYNWDSTVDISLDGTPIATDISIVHTNNGVAEDPIIGWFGVTLRNQDTVANGGSYLDSIVIETLAYEPPVTGTVIYEDDFSGAAGTAAKDSVPETTPTGFLAKDYLVALNGAGVVESTNRVPGAGFRCRMGTDPLSDDIRVGAVKLTVWARIPTNDWIGIGFAENDLNGVLTADANTGPWLQLNPASINVRGGERTEGSSQQFNDPYQAGDEVVIEFTYHKAEQTGDLYVDNEMVVTNLAMVHEYPAGTTNNPVLHWLTTQYRLQPTAANGGGYIDRLRIETFEVEVADFARWMDDHGLSGADAERSADPDDDGMDNLLEYALGGNPGINDAATVQPLAILQDDVLTYIYSRRLDAEALGLDYGVILRESLTAGSWTNIGTIAETGSGAINAEFESVTNSIPATNMIGFASLEVTEAE